MDDPEKKQDAAAGGSRMSRRRRGLTIVRSDTGDDIVLFSDQIHHRRAIKNSRLARRRYPLERLYRWRRRGFLRRNRKSDQQD